MEASGTGNMKLALNGALTIGTMDGATIEIAEEIGAENLYLFGLTAEEIQRMRSQGSYNPWDYYTRSAKIRRVMEAIDSDRFCPGEPGLFRPIYENLLNEGDFYFNLADFESYLDAQERAALEYPEGATWTRKAALTIARTGKFSSDRAVSDYARDIWNIDSPCSGDRDEAKAISFSV
jgi:starch phosphorylase